MIILTDPEKILLAIALDGICKNGPEIFCKDCLVVETCIITTRDTPITDWIIRRKHTAMEMLKERLTQEELLEILL